MDRFEVDLLARMAKPQSRGLARMVLPFQAAAVIVAFTIGLCMGLSTPAPAPPAQALLADVLEP